MGIGHATPKPVFQEELWEGFFRDHFGDNRLARTIWTSAGIRVRHFAIDPIREPDVSGWSTAQRMRRFLSEAGPVGLAAVTDALAQAELAPADVGLLAVVSSTGHVAPGLDALLANELGMPAAVDRLVLGHMGGHAALPGLKTVADHVTVHDRPAVLLCLELSSLHIQPPLALSASARATENEVKEMVSHALFGDAACAVVLTPGQTPGNGKTSPLFDVVDVVSVLVPDSADGITLEITDHGFMAGITWGLPEVVASHVGDIVGELLARNGLTVDDVSGWGVHPGGPRMFKAMQGQLRIAPTAMETSQGVLRDFGNCATATILIMVERLLAEGAGHSAMVVLGVGPGVTISAALLRGRA